MDKRTVIAVVLAVVVIVGSMIVQQVFFAAKEPTPPVQTTEPGATTGSEAFCYSRSDLLRPPRRQGQRHAARADRLHP